MFKRTSSPCHLGIVTHLPGSRCFASHYTSQVLLLTTCIIWLRNYMVSLLPLCPIKIKYATAICYPTLHFAKCFEHFPFSAADWKLDLAFHKKTTFFLRLGKFLFWVIHPSCHTLLRDSMYGHTENRYTGNHSRRPHRALQGWQLAQPHCPLPLGRWQQ